MIICNDCVTTIIPTTEKAYCRCGKTFGYKLDSTIFYCSIASMVIVYTKNEKEKNIKIQVIE